jgi:hypothetical protein
MAAYRIWLLVAGPGWGKRTRARQLAAELGGPVTWLGPAERRADAARRAETGVAALIDPAARVVVLDALEGEADRAFAAAWLAEAGERWRDARLPTEDVAVWAIVCNLLLNLDETITRN